MCAPEIGKNILFGATANEAQQERRHVLKQDGLADHQQNGKTGVGITMVLRDSLQTFTQKVENKKEVANDENGINDQLDQERPQCFECFLLHLFQIFRFEPLLRPRAISEKVKFRCVTIRSP